MFDPTEKLEIAIEAMLYIALNSLGAPVQSRDITKTHATAPRYLEPILQKLGRAGLVEGIRGPKGGYRLARERRRITVGDIARVILAPDAREEAARDKTRDKKSDLARLVIAPLWKEAEKSFLERLDSVTLEELCRRARARGLEPPPARPLDFSI